MLGYWCYRCGQPVRGLVRHFSTILGDFVDTVFDLDSRLVRTIGPLLLRPGRLTIEYFEGHRVRFVSPVRLFLVLAIAAFFALRLTVDLDSAEVGFTIDGQARIEAAASVEEVERLRAQALAGIDEARSEPGMAPVVQSGLEAARAAIQAQAQARIDELQRAEPAQPVPPQAEPEDEDKLYLKFNDRRWDAQSNPVRFDSLGQTLNASLNRLIGRMLANAGRVRQDPALMLDAFLENLPIALFLMLPVFALLLKLFYVFKRRLYMEHLVVALHSHAFLCAALLLLALFMALRDATSAGGFWHSLLGWTEGITLVWMPLYLLVMQKRVYRQGWILTGLKYVVLGIAYTILLSFVTAGALVVSLATL